MVLSLCPGTNGLNLSGLEWSLFGSLSRCISLSLDSGEWWLVISQTLLLSGPVSVMRPLEDSRCYSLPAGFLCLSSLLTDRHLLSGIWACLPLVCVNISLLLASHGKTWTYLFSLWYMRRNGTEVKHHVAHLWIIYSCIDLVWCACLCKSLCVCVYRMCSAHKDCVLSEPGH